MTSYKDHSQIVSEVSPHEILGASPRPLKFHEKEHMALLDEFKCLYTAITRAKTTLWIYDSNSNKHLPMFDYWVKRNLVEVKHDVDEKSAPVFKQSLSSPQEWEESGDNLMQTGVYDEAEKCYMKAGALLKQLEAFIRAHDLAQATTHSDSVLQAYLLSFLLDPKEQYLEKIYDCLMHLGKQKDAESILKKIQQAN